MSKNFHYFVSSFDVWVTGTDLFEVLKRHKETSIAKRASVFYVPVAAEEPYGIEYYRPKVDGVILLDVVGYTAGERKELDKEEDLALEDYLNQKIVRAADG